jgi:hypothetical protein
MDKQLYDTRKEAKAEIAKMVVWDAKAVKIDTDDGTKWAIECNSRHFHHAKYMRTDGYVR